MNSQFLWPYMIGDWSLQNIMKFLSVIRRFIVIISYLIYNLVFVFAVSCSSELFFWVLHQTAWCCHSFCTLVGLFWYPRIYYRVISLTRTLTWTLPHTLFPVLFASPSVHSFLTDTSPFNKPLVSPSSCMRRTCAFSVDFCVKVLSQVSHWYSSSWHLCAFKADTCVNVLPHFVQLCGFSVVCVTLCEVKVDFCANVFSTLVTTKWFFPGVCSFVSDQSPLFSENFITHFTTIWLVPSMCSFVWY